MANAQSEREKESFLLVRFFHGLDFGEEERYTDWTQNFLGHWSTPDMEVVVPENVGTFSDTPLKITMDIQGDDFLARISSGVPFSPIVVEVDEVTQTLVTGGQNSQRRKYNGRVVRTIRNFEGDPNKLLIEASAIKNRLDIQLGMPCGHQCPFTLFNAETCQLDRSSFTEAARIDSIDGMTITVTDAAITGQAGTYWKRGYLERDGLRIAIRDWSDADPTILYTARRVPNDWVGPTITFVPGCDKTVETCRTRYNNEDHNGAIGFSMLPYNPNFEQGS